MNVHWLLRAKRWAQNSPSPGRIKLVFAVIAVCAALWGYEQFFGWPEALTPNDLRRGL